MILSQYMANLISMVKHLRCEISAILIVIRILTLLRSKCMFPSHSALIMRRQRPIPNSTMTHLIIPHLLHLLIIIIILIFKCEFRVLLDLIRHLFRLQTDNVKFAVLFVVDLSLVKCQTIISVVGQIGLC